MHWKDHVKVFPRRQHVTLNLTAVPGISLVYVVVEKAAIPASAAMKSDPEFVPWNLLAGRIHFDAQHSWDGLQAADQYAGMLSAALRPDQFGNYEPHHLLAAVPQIRRVNGQIFRYGFKLPGNPATLEALPWWSQSGI